MRVTYIYHSGFLVETERCYYLFDYYRDPLPPLNPQKPILVFASHSHGDHYNPQIFTMLLAMGMQQITAVLAREIPLKRYLPCMQPVEESCPEPVETVHPEPAETVCPKLLENVRHRGLIPVIRVYHSREYDLPCRTHLQTLLSTDRGVAFFVTCPEGTIYHAGDLNEWNMETTPQQERRQMTGSYRANLALLKDKKIDIAFLPLDPRLGKHYADGFLYFLKNMTAAQIYPMHYWEEPDVIFRFQGEHPEYTGLVMDTEAAR